MRMGRWVISTSLAASWAGSMSCDGEAHADPPMASPQEASAGTVSAAERFAGRYRFVGGQSQRDAVLAAIDEVVAEMNMLARGIARDRLQESNPVPRAIEISSDDRTITIAFDDRSYTAPLDGSPTEVVGITGDTLTYRVTVSGDRIAQDFVGPKGKRHNTLRVDEDGKLEMRVEVDSESLPKPLRYRLSFRRPS